MRPPINQSSRGIELQMTAMIDVVFLLLIFFLWTTSFEKPEQDLASGIAISGGTATGGANQSPAPTQPLFEDLVITLQPDDTSSTDSGSRIKLRLNDQIVTLADLKSRLEEIASLGVQPPVVIAPMPGVKIGEAIKVHDAVKVAGLTKVLMAVGDE
jgi:biopolymer transport protein ExbD